MLRRGLTRSDHGYDFSLTNRCLKGMLHLMRCSRRPRDILRVRKRELFLHETYKCVSLQENHDISQTLGSKLEWRGMVK